MDELLREQLGRMEGKLDALIVQGANHEPRIAELERKQEKTDTRLDEVRRHVWRTGGVVAAIAVAVPFVAKIVVH